LWAARALGIIDLSGRRPTDALTLPSRTHNNPAKARRSKSVNSLSADVTRGEPPVIEADEITREFDGKVVLDGASLQVGRGEIHAVLGPNGAGKTTLLRILTGLLPPSSGTVRVLGHDATKSRRAVRQRLGLVPSGDRSLYLRISGIENLVFFARLNGMRRRAAFARAREVLAEVDLLDAARQRVGLYSHGMQKRLSVARALLTDPSVLLVDEATHDLDPEGARRVRDLIRDLTERGAAVVWATQRIEEIRGFVSEVTLLNRGIVRFSGTVPELMSHTVPRRYVVRLRNGQIRGPELRPVMKSALDGRAAIEHIQGDDSEHYVLTLADGVVLGDAISSLTEAEIQVLSCSEERSEIEEAFLSLTRESRK
jgi:ABC-2 type transport system ATP-binding protein